MPTIVSSRWPNLRSLRIGGAKLVDSVPIHEVIVSLPPTLTSLIVGSGSEWDGGHHGIVFDFDCGTSGIDVATLSSMLSTSVPNLLEFDVRSHAFTQCGSDSAFHWPAGLRTLGLVINFRNGAHVSRRAWKKVYTSELQLALPPSLAHCGLSIRSAATTPTGFIKASGLPAGLLTLDACAVFLDFDAPLPVKLETLRVMPYPSWETSKFPLPKTITSLLPVPQEPADHEFEPNIRVMMKSMGVLATVPLLNKDAERDWIAYEQSDFLNQPKLKLMRLCRSFCSPRSWHFDDCVPPTAFCDDDLFYRFMSRLGKTLRVAYGICDASLVAPIITYCPWLTYMQLKDGGATKVFMVAAYEVARTGAVGGVKCRFPHLLESVELSLTWNSLGEICSLKRDYPLVQFPLIRTVTYSVANAHSFFEPLIRETLAHVFPNARHMDESSLNEVD
jgi:hypothetical protein